MAVPITDALTVMVTNEHVLILRGLNRQHDISISDNIYSAFIYALLCNNPTVTLPPSIKNII